MRAMRGVFGGRPVGFRGDGLALFDGPVGRPIALAGYQGGPLPCAGGCTARAN